MRLKPKLAEEPLPPETKLAKSAKELVRAVDEIEEKRKLEEALKYTIEKHIEKMILGERKPTIGEEYDIKVNGKFIIFGVESTKDSFYRFTYPPKNGEAPQETSETETTNKKQEPPETESSEELIYLE